MNSDGVKRGAIFLLAMAGFALSARSALGAERPLSVSARLSDPATQVKPPADAIGFPERSAGFDALPGFEKPPPGYGEVPFWWWTGEDLDVDRLLWQVRELHKMGISGVQVNYSHYDTPGWLTEMDEPELFSDEWWKVYAHVSEECAKFDMGIGLSTYTLDWPRGAKNLFYDLFYCKPELNAIELTRGGPVRVRGGETKTIKCVEGCFAVCAYEVQNGVLKRGGIDLTPEPLKNKHPASYIPHSTEPKANFPLPLSEVTWTAPDGEWEIWSFGSRRKEGSLNPLMAGAGDTVIRGFYQKFQDNNPGKSSKGLNYFFNDELHIGLEKFAWNPDFTEQFRKQKGYGLLEVLPAMWTEMGEITPKVRMDYADVRMTLMEERYFKPIYDWHAARGMTYGCDPGSRGLNPNEFGDYFRANRWYSAPGHDTPGGNAHLIKGKVSSSIANLYRRPRVWLEGYHSLGWGATPERLMFATRENYLYGCTLFNLHGLYYSTYGSHWEWAPPCYHFRMPYWPHMRTFLGYFDRLSFLMSQGHTLCDVAVVYPVAPYEAGMDGKRATEAAFDLGNRLFKAGINFEFVDNDSLARAKVRDGRLVIDSVGVSYQALVVPQMQAVRRQTIEAAVAFAEGGGYVYCIGAVPSASDHAGRDDPWLDGMNGRAFKPACLMNDNSAAVDAIAKAFVQDVRGVGCTVRALHRRVGFRDVYLVMDAAPGDVVEFRVKGAADLWDPWSGETRPLRVVEEKHSGTRVELPLERYEAQVVVFTPDKKHVNPPAPDKRPVRSISLPDEWRVSFEPTMDNRYGDFRLPAIPENAVIGLEARRFTCADETPELAGSAMKPSADDSGWRSCLHGYGPKFYMLGPVPPGIDVAVLDAQLAALMSVDPAVPVKVGGSELKWSTYDFSWRFGKEGDLGHQGYHGLKRTVTDDFICLGKPKGALNETQYVEEIAGGRYYLWTSATVPHDVRASICASGYKINSYRKKQVDGLQSNSGRPEVGPPMNGMGEAREGQPPDGRETLVADKSHTSVIITPAAVYINGSKIADPAAPVALKAGANPTLVRYDHAGRGHFVMRRADVPLPQGRAKLAMRWYDDPGILPFDIHAGQTPAQWLRFTTAPGTSAIRLRARGKARVWIDGKPMAAGDDGRFTVAEPVERFAVVAVRTVPEAGFCGGACIEEPVTVETAGSGILALGDWSKVGILNNYSGGVRYHTTADLPEDQTQGKIEIDLGKVVATAEIFVNGRSAGVRVAPPWRLDISGRLKPGANRIEVLVYNTLANHYQTIPSRYRGSPESGLFGPVRLLSRDWQRGDVAGMKVLSRTDGFQVALREGSLSEIDRTVRESGNLLRVPGLTGAVSGTSVHDGGGGGVSALFNGTAGNGSGGEGTENDGRTFVGLGTGNTLELAFDPDKAPRGVTIEAVRTYAGHADARSSQNYDLYVSTLSAPDTFIRIGKVDSVCAGGLNEVSVEPLASSVHALQSVRRVRFVFRDGPLGFNVYREITVAGKLCDER